MSSFAPVDLDNRSPRAWLRSSCKRWSARAAAVLHALRGPRARGCFGVLAYHRAAPAQGGPPPTFNVTPARLRSQLAGLLRRGFVAWPLSRVLAANVAGQTTPPRLFVVTFDDGHASVARWASPILKELRVPAAIFLATKYLDDERPFPQDDWASAGSPTVDPDAWRPLRWEECQRMADEGWVEFGAHTHTHADFRGRGAELADDLRVCADLLRRRLGVERPAFAFPYGVARLGFCSADLRDAARQAGMTCALSTESELVRPGQCPFTWGRFEVDGGDSAGMLAGKLSGWFTAARDGWRALRGSSR